MIEKIIQFLLSLFGSIQRERDRNEADEQKNDALEEAGKIIRDTTPEQRDDYLERLSERGRRK